MNLTVLTMTVMILFYQIEDVINVYLHLLNEFHFKLNVIIYISLISIVVGTIVIV